MKYLVFLLLGLSLNTWANEPANFTRKSIGDMKPVQEIFENYLNKHYFSRDYITFEGEPVEATYWCSSKGSDFPAVFCIVEFDTESTSSGLAVFKFINGQITLKDEILGER